MDELKVVHQPLSQVRFEAKSKALVAKYPKADKYTKVIYDDGKRWAEYVSPYGNRRGRTARV